MSLSLPLLAYLFSISEALALAAAVGILGALLGVVASRLAHRGLSPEEREALTEETVELTQANEELASVVERFRKVEQRLRQSEAKYRTLIEHANDAIVIIQDNQVRFANPKTWEILGYDQRALMARSFTDVVAEEDRELVVDRYVRRQRGEDVPSRYNFRTIRADGSKLWVEINSVVVTWEGRPATLCFLRDISQQVQARDALAASQQRLQAILDHSTAVVYVKDAAGRYVLINRLFERLFGVSRDQVVGKTDFDLWPHELAEAFRRNDRLVLESGEPLQVEEQAPHDDGLHTYLSNKFPLFDETGRIDALCGISADITDRIQAELELRESEARNRAILEATPDMLFVVDREGICRQAKLSREYVPLEIEAVVGRRLTDFFPADLSQRFLAAIRRTLDEGQMQTFEVRLPTPLGLRHLESRVVVYGNQATLFIVRDVTERKRTEAELKEAKMAAEAASRAKSEFLANMSHELRTPMNAIIGLAELVQSAPLDEPERKHAQGIVHSAEFMISMINTILDFSKIEAGRLMLDPVEFWLRDDLADTLNALALRAHEKDLDLILDVRPEVPERLVADSGRLRQIVFNLVGNAVKFTARGRIVVRIEVQSREGSRATLLCSVADTGIGIAPEVKHAIFEPFRQGDGSTTRRYGGTGLGLAICAQLTERMGGRIWVESQPGRGSTFYFTVGVEVLGEAAEAPYVRQLAAAAGRRVLVIDAPELRRQSLTDQLVAWGLVPHACARIDDALEALEAASAEARPDVVMLDAGLPADDLLRLAARLDALEPRPALLVFARAIDRMWMGQRPHLANAAVVGKPVRHRELAQALATLLGAAARTEKTADEPAAGGWGAAPRPLRILLVEDNLINQRVARAMLSARGHSVETAGDGREALRRLSAQEFDVVLMDVQMPELGGFETTLAIRRREEGTGRRLPIVAMTAHALAGDRQRCLEAGMDDYLAKPIRARELFEAVERFASGVAVSPAESPPVAPPAASADKASGSGTLSGPVAQGGFNLRAALESVGGDERLLREIVGLFLGESGRLIDELAGAVGRGDGAGVRQAAHKLKNSAGYLGMERAFDIACQLENMGRMGDLDGAAGRCDELRQSLARLRPELATWVGLGAAAGNP